MDGIRGVGAFCVLTFHFWGVTGSTCWLTEDYFVFEFLKDGEFWVQVFFILSGFVLPISFLKSEKQLSIYGSAVRRLIRLMFPMLVINICIYFVKQLLWDNRFFYAGPDKCFSDECHSNYDFSDMLVTTLVTVWFGDDHWNTPTWTLSVELWGSFLVYFMVITLYNYQYRYGIYVCTMIFFSIAQYKKKADYSQGNNMNEYFMALFIAGLLLSDMENANDWGDNHPNRPLEKIRKLPLIQRSAICTVLWIITLFTIPHTTHEQPA